MPLTRSEIKNERMKSMKLLEIKDKLSQYEEKIIDIICKEFELTYFRSPSLKELSLILSKTMKNMKKGENITIQNTINSSLLENTMLHYVKFVKTQQPNQSNTKMIVDGLIYRME
eukprot:UN06118